MRRHGRTAPICVSWACSAKWALPPLEAIVAGTKTAASCLGWEADIGTLEAGKFADVVLCQGDPLADIRILEDTANIALVMQGGRVCARTSRAA